MSNNDKIDQLYETDLKIQEEYVNGLDTDIKISINWYTLPDNFSTFNERIRKNIKLTIAERRHQINIDNAFNDVPQLQKAITVYRGIKGNTYFPTDKTFISTSLSEEVSKTFSNKECCIYQITVSAGSKVLPLRNISEKPDEEEVLLDRDGNFSLTGTAIRENKKIFFITYFPKLSQELKEDQVNKQFLESELIKLVENRMIIESEEDDEDLRTPIDIIIRDIYKRITNKNISDEDIVRIKSKLKL